MFEINELPEGYEDAIYIDVDIKFDLIDRIKVFLGYWVTAKTQMFVQHYPGKRDTKSSVRVWKPRRRGITYVATEPEGGELWNG